MERLDFENGKYSVILNEDGTIERFLRHGEDWPVADNLKFSKFILSLIDEIRDHRKRNVEEHKAEDGTVRKSHYLRNERGEQPWDTAVRRGWGPIGAAFSILSYLRRDKDRDHSTKSAKWYRDRLREFVESNTPGALETAEALSDELTKEEFQRISDDLAIDWSPPNGRIDGGFD